MPNDDRDCGAAPEMHDVPDDLAPEAIGKALTTAVVGRAIEVQARVESTNDLALHAAAQGAPEGLCILADQQTGGRGRRGRPWLSLPGLGLYASILLRPGVPAPQVALLTFAAGLAAVEAVRATCGLDPALKWPNDLVLGGRKLAGILTEAQTLGSQVCCAVVGVGINVHHRAEDLPGALRGQATSVWLETGRRVERSALAAALFTAMDDWYAVLRAGGGARIVAAARERSAVLGRPIRVSSGDASWDGVALDLDEEGALLVRDDGGRTRRLMSEEVSIRTPGRQRPGPGG
jgi:BirA family biotin operon repressor/biotin-[acetyl-CoA-carboxylase] ligase